MDERLLHETKIHGTVEFPFAVYLGRVPEYLTAEQAQSEKAEYYNIMFNFSLLGRTVWQRSI